MGTYETTMLKLEKMAQANTATQMNWQEKMSKTSHQMEVEDLVKAGLNPVLSSNEGANAYTTSVDSAVNGIAGMASAREGANATRYAARQSAAATRAAAAAQLEAARISAQAQVDAAKEANWRSPTGALANIASAAPALADAVKNFRQNFGNQLKNPVNFYKNHEVSNNYSDLNTNGKRILKSLLANMNMPRSQANLDIAMRGLFLGDNNALAKLKAWAYAFNKKKTSSAMQKGIY